MRHTLGKRIALDVKVRLKAAPAGLLALYDFVLSVREGQIPDQKTIDILAERFEKILDGMPPDKALLLYRGSGRPARVATVLRDLRIAVEVLERVDAGDLRDVAIHAVGRRRHKSFGTVEAAYHRHKSGARRILKARVRLLEEARKRPELVVKAASRTK